MSTARSPTDPGDHSRGRRRKPVIPEPAPTIPQLTDDYTAWLVTSLALRLSRSAASYYARAWGIGTTEYRLVLALGKVGAGSAIHVAAAADVDKAAASRSLQTLVREGFVEVSRQGRSLQVRLSARGQALHDALSTASGRRDRRLTRGLAEGELQQLRRTLRRLIDNLPSMDDD